MGKDTTKNHCKNNKSGGSAAESTLFRLMALFGAPWPLGRGQNWVNMCKREESGGSGVAQKLLGLMGALEGPWPLGKGQT